jgi:hypothetical protein
VSFHNLIPGSLGSSFLSVKDNDGVWLSKRAPSIDGIVYDDRRGLGTPRDPQPMRCLQLNGTNQYIRMSVNPVKEFPFTLFGWARKSNTDSQALCAVSSAFTDNQFMCLRINHGTQVIINRRNGAIIPESTETVNVTSKIDQWSSFVCMFVSATRVVVYKDAVQVADLTGLPNIGMDMAYTRFICGVRRLVSIDAYLAGRAMHCGLVRDAVTQNNVNEFHDTGIMPFAEVLLALDDNSTTVAYNAGSKQSYYFLRSNGGQLVRADGQTIIERF